MGTMMQTIKAQDLPGALSRQLILYKKPVWIHGASGIGKSAIVKQWSQRIAEELGKIFWEVRFDPETSGITRLPEGADPNDYWGFIDLRAVLLDVLDVKGTPFLDRENEVTRFLRASLLPDDNRHGIGGTFFMDELAQAVPMVTNGLSQLIYDRRIGDSYSFPENWVIVAAGNRKEDNAATSKAGAHLYNRFAHYEMVPDAKAFSAWLKENGGDWRVANFCQFRPALMHAYQKGDIVFPTPRGFELVSKIVAMQYGGQLAVKDTEMERDIAANIGIGPAAELCAFLEICSKIVTYSQVIGDPKGTPVPGRGDDGALAATYAIMGMLTAEAKERDMDKIMVYVERFPSEFQAMFVLELKQHREQLLETLAITKWRKNHPSVAV